jgi:Ser/Thr protein kinase RdoA (MazF antagonist)
VKALASRWRAAVPRSVPHVSRVADRVRARLDGPAIGRDECAIVLGEYGLRVGRTPRNLGHGWRNDLVAARTNGGEVVLKRYPRRWTEATLAHEHSIVLRLEERGFPAVRLKRTTGGRTWVERGGHLYVVFDFSEGRNVTGTRASPEQRHQQLAQAAVTLARFHRVMEGFQPAGAHHITEHAGGGDDETGAYRRLLADITRQSHELRSHHPAAGQLDWLCGHQSALDERLHELGELLRRSSLRRHVIHGDYGLHNLLFRADGTAVLHDFELARVEYRLVDLVGVLSRAETDPADVFIERYCAENEVDPGEWALLPAVWEQFRICGAVRSWHNYLQYGDEKRLRTAQQRIAEANAVRAEGVAACR